MIIKIYNITQWIIIGISLALVLVLAISMMAFKIYPYVVVSGSMEPELKVGSVCFVNCRAKEPKVGSIVTYKAGEANITHRIIEVCDDGYITKGDSNQLADPGIVKKEKIVGTSVLVIPNLGKLVLFMRTTRGIILVALAAAVFAVTGFLIKDKRKEAAI